MFQQHNFNTHFISGVSGYYGNEGKTFSTMYGPKNVCFSECLEKKFSSKTIGWGISSDILFQEAAEIIANTPEQNNFIFISTIDTHPPYGHTPPKEDICWQDTAIANNNFLLSLCAIDRNVANFIKSVKKTSRPFLVIITADHSAVGGENYTNRKLFLPDRIPLIFVSNIDLSDHFNQNNNNFASQIDLAPTLLNLLGFETPPSFMGCQITSKNTSVSYFEDKITFRGDINGIVDIQNSNGAIKKWLYQYYGN